MGNAQPTTDVFRQEPSVVPNADPVAPMALVLSVDVNVAGTLELMAESEGVSQRYRWQVESGVKSLPVVGLKPARSYRLEVSLIDAQGQRFAAKPLTVQTPAPPISSLDFPPLRVNRAQRDRMEPGLTLLSVRRRALGRSHRMTAEQRRFTTDWSLILALDEDGEIVWFYRSPARISGVAALENGHLFFHTTRNSPTEIDWLGRTLRCWGAALGPAPMPPGAVPVQAVTLHHQPDALPNGNFLSLNAVPRLIENYYTSETDATAPRRSQWVMGDEVIEFTLEGEVVWRWNCFDHLDPFKIGYDTFWSYWWVRGFPDHLDWTHGNGVHHDPRDNSVLLSLRNLDAVIKIDRSTGQIRWILARDIGWSEPLRAKLLRPVGPDFILPSHQHNPRLTPQGHIVVFNNNVHQAIPFTGERVKSASESMSQAVVYEIDEVKQTARVVFSTPTDASEGAVSFAMGDAHVLPRTGNVLVDFSLCYPGLNIETFDANDLTRVYPDDLPSTPRIREYAIDDPQNPVFDVEVVPLHDLVQMEVFGVARVAIPDQALQEGQV
ncbi:MAG: hypothetical protein RLZZ177_220 [Pseudomonadota bacterium]